MFKATVLRDISMQKDTTKPLDHKADYVVKKAGEVLDCHESFRFRFGELRNYIKIEDDSVEETDDEVEEEKGQAEETVEDDSVEETDDEVEEEKGQFNGPRSKSKRK